MDAGHVTHRLWQGSVPTPGAALPFDLVVLCAEEHQFPAGLYGLRPFGNRARILRCPLTDRGQPLSAERTRLAFRTAVEVAHAYLRGERIVVTCQAGLNRSGLVVALALLELGVDSTTAIHRIRMARPPTASSPGALCNPHFVQLILSVAGRSMIRMPISPSSALGGAYS